MSKASEYAKVMSEDASRRRSYELLNSEGYVIACVTDSGNYHQYTFNLLPEEALNLADWIKDVFGD